MVIDKSTLIAELCSNIATVKDLDKFLLDSSTSITFKEIFQRDFVIAKEHQKVVVRFSNMPLQIASFVFHIKDLFVLEDFGDMKNIFESICEIIKKREDDFKDGLTKLLNMQGFVQSLINSTLDNQDSRATFLALKIDSKNGKQLEPKAILGIANRLKKLKLNDSDVISRWSYNIFCFFIIPDNNYTRVLEVEAQIRTILIDLDLNINIGIHRLPNPIVHFRVDTNLKDRQILDILESSNFKEIIAKTFRAMASAIDKTFLVGAKVYKDLRTKEFIKAQGVPAELLLRVNTKSIR